MKSSIHVEPIKIGSENHNQRKQNLDYVRKDLSHQNESFIKASISDTRIDIETRYKESTGQKMQAKSTPIREAVLLIDKNHTIKDLKELGDKFEQRFGIKTIQAYTHKDEGHYDKVSKEWKSNFHAHMVIDWTDKKGKSIKLSREDMAEMQTITANHLKMERGRPSTKNHIQSREFKVQKLEEEVKHQTEQLGVIIDSKPTIEEVDNIKIIKSGFLRDSIDHEKTSKKLREALKSQILSSNKEYVEKIKERDLKLLNIDKITDNLIKRIDNYKNEPSKINELKIETSLLRIKSITSEGYSKEQTDIRLKSVDEELFKRIEEQIKESKKEIFKNRSWDKNNEMGMSM